MSERDPRKMALQIAGVRASEMHLPEDERIFYDPYAEYFLNEEMREGLRDLDKVRAAISQYEQMMPGVNGAIVVNASGPGSAFVADYFSAAVIDGTSPLKEAQVLRQFVESEGAPLQFGIKEGEIEEFFKKRGFNAVTNVTSASCKKQYFKNASCDRSVSPMFNMVYATVSPQEKTHKNLS